MKTLQELQFLILQWADKKNLLKLENAPKQRLKLLEEIGETAGAILKNKPDEISDGIGDCYVVLVILSEQLKQPIKLDIEDFTDEPELDYCILFDHIINKDRMYFALGYLNNICIKLGVDLTQCANLAWDEIKDRTGKTVNGTFIKN